MQPRKPCNYIPVVGIIGQRGRLSTPEYGAAAVGEAFGDDALKLLVVHRQPSGNLVQRFVMRIGNPAQGCREIPLLDSHGRTQVEERMPLHRQHCPFLAVIIFVFAVYGRHLKHRFISFRQK